MWPALRRAAVSLLLALACVFCADVASFAAEEPAPAMNSTACTEATPCVVLLPEEQMREARDGGTALVTAAGVLAFVGLASMILAWSRGRGA